MTGLTATLIAVLGIWALAFFGASFLIWTAAIGLFLVGLYAAGIMGSLGLTIATLIFVPIALLFNLKGLRRSIVTKRIFKGFKAVLPPISDTEREALEAGDVWWEGEMFRGKPDWQKLLSFDRTKLTDEEQSFLDNEVSELCDMLDEWKIVQEDMDLPQEVWDHMAKKRFFGMLIPKEHGGTGFSAYAQSCVVTKIATRSLTAAVTVMVPNSLGPGELLTHYGTKEQQKKWLKRLADGKEIPCFGLTGPEVGSDASKLPDTGIVCKGQWEGKEVLGMKLNFSKRYITLAPVATVVGLAFKLKDPDGLLGDPDKEDYGITCALIPADVKGVEIGRRHFPGSAFMNGPIVGKDVFVPLDHIIGGPEMAGHGWRMLVECLSAGRGISLPALSTAAAQAAYRAVGPYSLIRRQFKVPIGKFEGVQEATGRIAGLAYRLEAMRILTASAVDTCAPSVVTALSKYHMTEMMRQVVIDSMDVVSGRGVIMGPRNFLAPAYQAIPVAITVEGANILTRNLMIFGQGSIRCHPYVFPEMEAARNDDLNEFDSLLWSHVGFSINRGVRAFTFALTRSAFAGSPVTGPMAKYYRRLTRMSSALAFTSDVTMGVLGGELKRKERLSARLGDVLSHLYMASAVLKYYYDEGEKEEDRLHAQWAVEHSLSECTKAFDEFFRNFPNRFVGLFLRAMVLPFGRSYEPPSDKLNGQIADMMMEKTDLRDRLTHLVYFKREKDDQYGLLELALDKLLEVNEYWGDFQKYVENEGLHHLSLDQQLKQAAKEGLVPEDKIQAMKEYDELRFEVISVDDFSKEYLKGLTVGEKGAEKAKAA